VDTLSPRSHCCSKPDRSLAKPSASRCIKNVQQIKFVHEFPSGVRTLQTWILSVLLSIVCTALLIALVKMSHRDRSNAFAPLTNPGCAQVH
jgi:hypothetical protein